MEKLKDEISVKNESQEIDLSFWDVLHDATLKQIVSDAMERTVMLEFEIEYLREFANLPTGISWCLIFHDASKLLLFVPRLRRGMQI